MGNPLDNKETEWILDAIHHLKHRKARPDLSRISWRMKKKHHLNFAQTKQLLDSLIEEGVVVKAVYKNNTSYRDVTQCKRPGRPGVSGGGQLKIKYSKKMSMRFLAAIRAKEMEKGTGVGLTCADFQEHLIYLQSCGDKCFLSKDALQESLDHSVVSGYLLKCLDQNNVPRYFVNDKCTEDFDKLDQDLNMPSRSSLATSDLELAHHSITNSKCSPKTISSKSKSTLMTVEEITTHLKTCILSALLGTEEAKNMGRTFEEVRDHVMQNSHESVLFNNDAIMCQLMQLVMESVLKIDKDKFKPCNLVPITEVKPQVQQPVTIDTNVGLDTDLSQNQKDSPELTEQEMQAKVLQGLSLVPVSSTFKMKKDTPGSLSSLKVIPDISESNAVKRILQPGPSRLPSKRKRIMKNHGPDFEIEMPIKISKGKTQTQNSVFPTPTSSPSSERADCTLDQSLKSDSVVKRRGRPPKKEVKREKSGAQKTNVSLEEDSSLQSTPSLASENSQPCPSVEPVETARCSPVPTTIPDVNEWSAQQVADYFKEKGYVDEALNMLENDIDGAALGMLKRSDVVGPPLGGVLHVKKLGTALKLFRDIRNLLFRGNADNYIDPYEERSFIRS